MAWKLNGTRIYVTELTTDTGSIIARLQPLDDDTVLHFFGTESDIHKVGCTVVGDTNMLAVKALKANSAAVTFTNEDNVTISVYLSKIGIQYTTTIWQSLDSTQDCDAPVYKISLELYV